MSATETSVIETTEEETTEAPVETTGSGEETAETTGGGIITVTAAATAKIAELIGQEVDGDRLALRVAVRPGGCSGFSYDMFFDSDITDEDNLHAVTGAVRVVIDPASAQMLQGATLDYSDGLQDAGFHITNPNASKSCGCGNSFS